MHKWIAVICILAVGSLVSAPSALAMSSNEFVYVESNIQSANGNSVFAFQRQADGSLSQIPGSPFLTGGAGTQTTVPTFGALDTDSEVVVDSQRRLLFAVNAGSDTVAVFHINSDGSLNPVTGSPFPSGGTNPVSVAVTGQFLAVVNQNGDVQRAADFSTLALPLGSINLPNYTTFHINADGSLTPVNGSTVNVALGSSPSQALAVPGTNLLFGADFLGGLLQSFTVDYQGMLHQRLPISLPPAEFGPAPRVALGLITHPFVPVLYAGFPAASRLGVFKFNAAGEIHFVRSVPNSGSAICWLRPNKAGTRLYTSNQGSFTTTSTISVYDLTDPENPKEIQSVTLQGVTTNSTQIELSKDGTTLYAVSQHINTVTPASEGKALHTFSVAADGTLSETQTPLTFPVPDSAQPQGLAIFVQQ